MVKNSVEDRYEMVVRKDTTLHYKTQREKGDNNNNKNRKR